MVMAGQSHGCGTAQKNIQKLFFGWGGEGWAEP